METSRRALCLPLACLALASPAFGQVADIPDSVFVRQNFTKHEYRIPMRDGVRLLTIAYVPNDASPSHTYPIVIQRTCYSVAPYGPASYARTLGPDRFMMHEKYIFVHQDVRGRYSRGIQRSSRRRRRRR